MRPNIVLVVFLLFAISSGNAANIYFSFGLSTYSHRISVWPLVEALADKGHNITFATTYHPKISDPRIREFFPKEFEKQMNKDAEQVGDVNFFEMRLGMGRLLLGIAVNFVYLPQMGHSRCEYLLNDPEAQDFIRNSKFDLVILDSLFNECGLGLAAKWGAKTMVFGTTHPFEWTMEPYGVTPETSTTPSIHISFQYPLSFIQRVFGTLFHLSSHYFRQYVYFPKLEQLLREKLDFPEMPPMAELEKQISVMLYNSHFSEELARSLPPFYVPVGGMHCELSKHDKRMDKDLRKFIDGSGDAGFILVSFGGEAKISDAPPVLRNIFLTAFANSNIKIVLRWDGERPKDMPDNVFTVNWYPQKKVLASKNIKAFITHGGLLSMHEAITHGVPMIAFPIFAEQDYNAFRLDRTKRGIMLELSTLTVEVLQDAIYQILNDKCYKDNMEKVSQLFKDRPAKPLETALWWTDYVLRHDDTSHLKPLAMEQFWFQRRLLDVWAFLLIVLIVFTWLSLFVMKKIVLCLFDLTRSNSKGSKKSLQRNSTSKKTQ